MQDYNEIQFVRKFFITERLRILRDYFKLDNIVWELSFAPPGTVMFLIAVVRFHSSLSHMETCER